MCQDAWCLLGCVRSWSNATNKPYGFNGDEGYFAFGWDDGLISPQSADFWILTRLCCSWKKMWGYSMSSWTSHFIFWVGYFAIWQWLRALLFTAIFFKKTSSSIISVEIELVNTHAAEFREQQSQVKIFHIGWSSVGSPISMFEIEQQQYWWKKGMRFPRRWEL